MKPRMVDRIFVRQGSVVFGKERPVGDRRFADLGKRAGQTDQSRVKRRDKIGKPRRRVALRIDRDEQGLNRIGSCAELVERERDRLKLGRAHVGTIRIAEIKYDKLAAKIRIGAAMAGLIGELERTADRRAARQQAFDQFRCRGLSRFRSQQPARRKARMPAQARCAIGSACAPSSRRNGHLDRTTALFNSRKSTPSDGSRERRVGRVQLRAAITRRSLARTSRDAACRCSSRRRAYRT